MSDDTSLTTQDTFLEAIIRALNDLIGSVPPSGEMQSEHPDERAREIVWKASLKAAVVSGSLSLPPGPLGWVTILPDLLAIWRIQAQMVADIAATYGKTASLGKEEMLYCLFRHVAAQAMRDIAVRVGQRLVIRRGVTRAIQHVLRRVGIRITQGVASRALSRFVPLLGALGVGAYAYSDTKQVGQTAIELFRGEIVVEEQGEGGQGEGGQGEGGQGEGAQHQQAG